MTQDTPLTVVVPVYHEGENIARWWQAAQGCLPPGARVLVVYDFEEDNTLPPARRLIDDGAPFELIRNRRAGACEAVRTGFQHVATGPVLVCMADLSDDLSIVGAMLDAYRAGAHVVVGSRYAPGGAQVGGPWLKNGLARWSSRSLWLLAGFPTRDATNNFRLYDAEMLHGLQLETTQGFSVAMEITVKAWIAGYRVAEIPSVWRDRSAGTSRFRLWQWLPGYGRWWLQAMAHGLTRGVRGIPRGRATRGSRPRTGPP